MGSTVSHTFRVFLNDRKSCGIGLYGHNLGLRKKQPKIPGRDALISANIKDCAGRRRVGYGLIDFFLKNFLQYKIRTGVSSEQ
jgi:hypothetical protein